MRENFVYEQLDRTELTSQAAKMYSRRRGNPMGDAVSVEEKEEKKVEDTAKKVVSEKTPEQKRFEREKAARRAALEQESARIQDAETRAFVQKLEDELINPQREEDRLKKLRVFDSQLEKYRERSKNDQIAQKHLGFIKSAMLRIKIASGGEKEVKEILVNAATKEGRKRELRDDPEIQRIRAYLSSHDDTNRELRLEFAKIILKRKKFSKEEEDAIMDAHNVGAAEGRKLGTYTKEDIWEKARILNKAKFSSQDRERLILSGITGNGTATPDADDESPEAPDSEPSSPLFEGPDVERFMSVHELARIMRDLNAVRNTIFFPDAIKEAYKDALRAEIDPEVKNDFIQVLDRQIRLLQAQENIKQGKDADGEIESDSEDGEGEPLDPDVIRINDSQLFEQLKRAKKVKRSSRLDMYRIKERLDNATDIQKVNDEIERLGKYVRFTRRVAKDKHEDYMRRYEQIKSNADINYKKQEMGKLLDDVKEHYASGVEAKHGEVARSLEELVELIMDSEEDKWRPGGEYELIDSETKQANLENFLEWVRSRMMYYHGFNPDSEINLFSEISIPTVYRSITISEIISTARYYMKRVPDKIKAETKDSKVVIGTTEVRDKEYEALKDQIVYEVWLFGVNHNNDAKYRLVMGQEAEMYKTILQINYNNEFTKDRNRMLKILKMSGAGDKVLKEILEGKHKTQGTVGRVIRRNLLAYYHIADEEMINRIFEKNRAMDAFYESVVKDVFADEITALKEEKGAKEYEGIDVFGEIDTSENGQKTAELRSAFIDRLVAKHGLKREEVDSLFADKKKFGLKAFTYKYENKYKEGTEERYGLSEIVFGNEGKLKELKDEMEVLNGDTYEYAKKKKERSELLKGKLEAVTFKALNPYNDPKKEEPKVKLLRNAVKAATAKSEGITKQNVVDYGDEWAFSFTYWSGIAAYNDLGPIGFNKDTNRQHAKDYEVRQAQGRGSIGIPDNVFGIKKAGLNLIQALKVRRDGELDFKTTFLEMLQGGEGDSLDLNSEDFKDFDFEGGAQRQFSVDHIGDGQQLQNFIIKGHGLNFDKLIKEGANGRIEINEEEADKMIKNGLWHWLRYTFDQPGFIWDKEYRGWWKEYIKDSSGNYVRDEQGFPKTKDVFKSKTLKEFVFSEEIIGKPKKDSAGNYVKDKSGSIIWEGGMKMYDRKIFNDEQRKGQLARDLLAWLVSKEIQWHRNWKAPNKRWTSQEVRLIREYFKLWEWGIEEHNEGKRTVAEGTYPFFSDKEWDRIVELAGVENIYWLEAGEVAVGTVGGAVGAMAKTFFKNLMK